MATATLGTVPEDGEVADSPATARRRAAARVVSRVLFLCMHLYVEQSWRSTQVLSLARLSWYVSGFQAM